MTASNEGISKPSDDVLKILRPREIKVLSLRFGWDGQEPLSLRKTGDLLRITKERVRHIQLKAMEKIRAYL